MIDPRIEVVARHLAGDEVDFWRHWIQDAIDVLAVADAADPLRIPRSIVMLKERIETDWKAARLKAREDEGQKLKASVLGLWVSAIETARKSPKGERDLTEDEVIGLGKYQLNKLVETKEIILKHPSRNAELAATEAQIAVLLDYLPQQMTEADLEAFARQKVAEGVVGVGPIMASLKTAHSGAYDGKLASAVIKRVLG